MGSPVFHTDTSIALRGVSRPFDPIQSFSRIARLRQLQQRGQINQQQLDDMERERARQQDIRASLAKGGTNADKLARLQEGGLPFAALDFKERFATQEATAATTRKTQLENSLKVYDIIGREAGPLKVLEDKGADLETMQIAYGDSLARLAEEGIDVSKLPQKYRFGMAAGARLEAVEVSKQIDQALQADAIEERKRPLAGRDVPFPPKVEAQRKRLRAAGPAQRRTATEIQIELYRKDPELYQQIFDRVGIRSERQMRLKVVEAAIRLSESVSGQVNEELFAKKLSELSALVGVSLDNQGQPQAGKTATREEVQAFAQSKGISFEEAATQLQAEGYTIQ